MKGAGGGACRAACDGGGGGSPLEEGRRLVRVIRKLGLRGWNGMWKSESDGM